MNKQKIYFCTAFARIDLIEKLAKIYDVVCIFPRESKYSLEVSKLINFASNNEIEFFQVKKSELAYLDFVDCKSSILLSAGFPLIFPRQFYQNFKFAINLHPTLLPRHRGKYVEYVFLEGDQVSGVTAHVIDDGVDTGPIILQSKFQVSDFDDMESIIRKSLDLEFNMIKEIMDRVVGKTLTASPQDDSLACTHITPRNPDDSEVSKELSLLQSYRISRAHKDNYPTFFEHDDHKIIVRFEVLP
jgi:methionyl-tRNA formyltransferase